MSDHQMTANCLLREQAQLTRALEHHIAHAMIACGELIELLEESDQSEIDGCELLILNQGLISALFAVRAWPRATDAEGWT